MATSSAEPLKVEMDPEQRSSDHISLHIRELLKRLDELPDQEERLQLEAQGRTVVEVAENLLPISYLEVQNLWSIEKDPILKLALADWKEKESFFSSRVFNSNVRIERMKNVVYQVVGIYFIFQVLNLLIAISKGACVAGPSKESRLYLIFLSLAASLLTIFVITKKFRFISSLEKTVWSEEQALKELVKRRYELARVGINYKFHDNYYNRRPPQHSSFGHYVMDYGAMFIFFQTAWVFPLAVWRISK